MENMENEKVLSMFAGYGNKTGSFRAAKIGT